MPSVSRIGKANEEFCEQVRAEMSSFNLCRTDERKATGRRRRPGMARAELCWHKLCLARRRKTKSTGSRIGEAKIERRNADKVNENKNNGGPAFG